MKNLYLIVSPSGNEVVIDNFKKSAKKTNTNIIEVYADTFNFTKGYNLTAEDGIYRVSSSQTAKTIERILANNQVKTLYKDYRSIFRQPYTITSSNLIHLKNNISIIPTIFSPSTRMADLEKYVAELGGFPIIVKADGGSHGIGIVQVDSLSGLKSVADLLSAQNKEYILRKYIPHDFQPRLIVLGNSVVGSIKYHRGSKDFREATRLEKFKFDPEVEAAAIKAVNILGYDFGGVDILLDENNKPVLAEVNFPCMFHGVQEVSGSDITLHILEYLASK